MIVQDDAFDATNSLTVCAFASDPSEAPQFRIVVTPSELNGLVAPSRLMVDKITTVPKSKFGAPIGRLASEDILRLDRAMLAFLGLAAAPTRRAMDD
ncbi:MAG: type II toxin-antitoxin system PemK/MazF family toxin [Roseiarcus sp.]